MHEPGTWTDRDMKFEVNKGYSQFSTTLLRDSALLLFLYGSIYVE